jgi:hypothetical protein
MPITYCAGCSADTSPVVSGVTSGVTSVGASVGASVAASVGASVVGASVAGASVVDDEGPTEMYCGDALYVLEFTFTLSCSTPSTYTFFQSSAV